MKPKVSIVIPVLNDERHIGKCIDSIIKSSFKNFEIIVVDDGSVDNTVNEIRKYPCRLVRLNNKGISYSRNLGAKRSAGNIVYFVDSDVVQHRDTIKRMVNFLSRNKMARIVCAFFHKKNLERGFVPEFLSLRFFYTLSLFKKDVNWVDTINSGAFMMHKNTFFELGGFNEKYNRPGGEEYDFSYRIFRKHLIHYSPDIFVFHHFKHFFPMVRNFFWRTSEWTKLLFKNKRFENAGNSTSGEALNAIIALFTILFLPFVLLNKNFFLVSAMLFLFFSIRRISMFSYMAKEKSTLFAIKGFFLDYFLYIVKSLGFIYGIIKIASGK